jgi:histidine ammonia-lyase
VIDHRNKNVFHGGNFHGDYVSLEMDKLKDRHHQIIHVVRKATELFDE